MLPGLPVASLYFKVGSVGLHGRVILNYLVISIFDLILKFLIFIS